MASNTFRSDPRRAAELACILTLYATRVGAEVKPHILADTVAAMQKAARSAKRQAEHACNYGYPTEAAEARAFKRQEREQAKLNDMLANMVRADASEVPIITDTKGIPALATAGPTVELGGDPRGPCAVLHIPGQRGDGWGEGFGIY